MVGKLMKNGARNTKRPGYENVLMMRASVLKILQIRG